MANKQKSQPLTDAKKYYKLLLYEASGGTLGTEPQKEIKQTNMTFAEKRGLLDSIIKVAQLEDKASENEDVPSGMDIIRRNLEHGGRTGRGRGNTWGTESSPDDGATDSAHSASEQGS